MSIQIPPNLARGYADQAWLDSLPSLVEHARERWALEIGDPYLPGGACSWVAAVDRDDAKLVLKVGLRDSEAGHEIDGLKVWAGRGAVLLHDSFSNENAIVLLLERCEPGTTLGTSLAEPEQDEVIADRLHRLWIAPPSAHPFRPLSAMTALWTETLERDLAQHHYDVDEELVDETRRIYREEGDNCPAPTLLCTDLHAANVLAAEREPWLVIDPKPFVGDPAYDTVQHMLNCLERLEQDPFALADRMASLTDVDPARVRMWLFARALQESLGDEDRQRRLRPVAARLGTIHAAQLVRLGQSRPASKSFLGSEVTVKIDRPMGSTHPERGFLYPVNYGFVPGVPAPDGGDLDAYVLGVFEPIEEFTGVCIAVVHRTDDDDDKLVVVPRGEWFTDKQIRSQTEFQEQWFTSEIWR